MEWINMYSPDNKPSPAEIREYISSPLWDEFNDFLKNGYGIQPDYSYSGCSGQPGWNIKYKKSGKSLCTLYPMEGFFIALVVVGAKEAPEAELLMPSFTEYTQNLYRTAAGLSGARWLMINVTDERIAEDAKQLIQLRRKMR